MKRFTIILAYHLLMALVTLTSTRAQSTDREGLLNKLLAPGKLIEGHKDLEKVDCLSCHDAGKGIPNPKCLECHKELAPFIASKRSLHGRTTKDCYECHSDHKGRDYDSTMIDEAKFNHMKETGYKLEGKHAKIKCNECHIESRKDKHVNPKGTRYFGAQSTCMSCHKKDDIHFFPKTWKKQGCENCHGLKSWKTETRFNHEKDANYKLEGHHRKLDCNRCHKSKEGDYIYDWAETQNPCRMCHSDHHEDRLSPKFREGSCQNCHSQTKWSIKPFEHGRITGYDLVGAHSELTCQDCHQQKDAEAHRKSKKFFEWKGLQQECLTCHADYHHFDGFKGQRQINLNACESCHSMDKWKATPQFDHNSGTNYPLEGAHKTVNCDKCHVSEVGAVKVGKYIWPNQSYKQCSTCHKSPHIDQFSVKAQQVPCQDCHTQEAWSVRAMKFNHNQLTRFPLTGKHTSLDCKDCHGIKPQEVYQFENVATQDFCVGCHKNLHEGQFSPKFSGLPCSQCHDTETFAQRKSFDHSATRFPLKGKHQKVECIDCHPKTKQPLGDTKKMASQFLFPLMTIDDCNTCHKDVHKGNYGARCSDCHSETSWKTVPDFHKDFSLTGVHYSLECQECHKGNRRLQGMSENCMLCHQADDAHQGTLPQCGGCHNQILWEESGFRHSMTAFPLRGIHRTLECSECHAQGVYRGLQNTCLSCHATDSASVSTPQHTSPDFDDCSNCHNQFSF